MVWRCLLPDLSLMWCGQALVRGADARLEVDDLRSEQYDSSAAVVQVPPAFNSARRKGPGRLAMCAASGPGRAPSRPGCVCLV